MSSNPEATMGKQEVRMFIGVLKTMRSFQSFPVLIRKKRKGHGDSLSTWMTGNAVLVTLRSGKGEFDRCCLLPGD